MNNKVLLINEAQVKAGSIIENNADPKVLVNVIREVQDIEVQPVLGNQLFDDLTDSVYKKATVEGYTMADDKVELLFDYVRPFMLAAITARWMLENNYKFTNKGILKLNDNSGQNLSVAELESAKNYFENNVATYKKRLIDYLKGSGQLAKGADTNITGPATGWFMRDTHGPRYLGDAAIYNSDPYLYKDESFGPSQAANPTPQPLGIADIEGLRDELNARPPVNQPFVFLTDPTDPNSTTAGIFEINQGNYGAEFSWTSYNPNTDNVKLHVDGNAFSVFLNSVPVLQLMPQGGSFDIYLQMGGGLPTRRLRIADDGTVTAPEV